MTEASQDVRSPGADTGLAPADEVLRERELLRAILATSVTAIVVLDAAGRIVFANDSAERILGLSKGQLAGRACTDPAWDITDLEGQRLPEDQLPFRRVTGTGRAVFGARYAFAGPDGQRRVLAVNGAPLLEGHAPTGAAVFSIADVTEQVQAEQREKALGKKLLEAQKLESLGVLAGGITHDFNNLLTAILGNAALARRDPNLTPQAVTCLEQVETISHRAAELCRQMLAYAGKVRFDPGAVNLNPLLRDLVPLLERSVGKNATLSFDLAAGLPLAPADAVQFRQVITNLVLNGSEALRPCASCAASGPTCRWC
jgi:PAS domain S-box-containing protein